MKTEKKTKLEILVFGASKAAETASRFLVKKYTILAHIDNDSKKWGKLLHNIPIVSPSTLANYPIDTPIIIASMYFKEISEQLEEMGYINYSPLPFVDRIYDLHLPNNPLLIEEVNSAATRLFKKLKKLEISVLSLSEYTTKYLTSEVRNLQEILKIYAYELCWALYQPNLSKEDFHILDYGGGVGILSLLASEYGINHSYYNDIYDLSVRESEIIAQALGYNKIQRICGDLIDVVSYSKRNKIFFNGLLSYNVIEHIYDITNFLISIEQIAANKAVFFMGTSATPYNDQIRQKYEIHQEKLETENRELTPGWKERDSLNSYYGMRLEIVSNYCQENKLTLENHVKEKLATTTRGMIKKDIEIAIRHFIETNIYPVIDPIYPTNTCDPLTGNWAEHFLDFDKLAQTLETNNFWQAQVIPSKENRNNAESVYLYAVKS